MVINLTAANFEEEIKNSKLPVVIDVYATWCGPCQMMAPVFDELSKEFEAKFKFAKLNIDEERDLAIQYNVSSIPTFIFIKEGEVVGKEMGYMDKEVFKKTVDNLLI